jgi:hypothetical protein
MHDERLLPSLLLLLRLLLLRLRLLHPHIL